MPLRIRGIEFEDVISDLVGKSHLRLELDLVQDEEVAF